MKTQAERKRCIALLQNNVRKIEPKQRVVVDSFKPEDAEGIALLYYIVYGSDFPIDYVYNPDLIREANAGNDLYQVVARTDSGNIVGLMSLFRISSGKGIMESGGWMVHPAYRHGTLAFRIAKKIVDLARDPLRLHVVFGQSVTDHLNTQKLGKKNGFIGLAFEVEPMPPRPEPEALRISLVDEFLLLQDIPHAVYLPKAYDSFLRKTYERTGWKRQFLTGTAPEGTTDGTIFHMDKASLAKGLVAGIGADFKEFVESMESTHPQQHVYHLQLPLSDPGLPDAVNAARERGYRFGGLLPLWTDRDVLLMQKVANTPDLSRPLILTDEMRELVDYIRDDMNA